jgi:hypothetical protein
MRGSAAVSREALMTVRVGMSKPSDPRFQIELAEGIYLVDVLPDGSHRAWHYDHGMFVGHGVKLEARASWLSAFNALNNATDDLEGTGHLRTYPGRLLREDGSLVRAIDYKLDGGFGDLSPASDCDVGQHFLLELKGGHRMTIEGVQMHTVAAVSALADRTKGDVTLEITAIKDDKAFRNDLHFKILPRSERER